MAAVHLLLLALPLALATTPWPLPLNLTLQGGAASIATISPSFAFSCDPACSSSCASSSIMGPAFERFSARLRPAAPALPPPAVHAVRGAGGAGYWWRFPGADCDGRQYDLGASCNGSDTLACQAACEANAQCGGFNTHGVLKNRQCGAPGSILPGAGCGGCVDLYLTRAAPEPPPGVLMGVQVCLLTADETLGPATDESYSLVAPNDGVGRITAASAYGALHAMESLVQLLDQPALDPSARHYSFAPVLIDDAPRFAYRGLLIDSSRHFLPLAHILHTIDALSYSKLNLLHWHLVDSISFPCGSDTFPALAQHGAYAPAAVYSPSDLRTVVAYGRARGVRVLPEWDLPGHGDWGGVPGIMGCPNVVDPTADALYTTLAGFLGEMAGIFTDAAMFLGGDEVNAGCWDENPAIAAWLRQHNMTSAQLQQYFWVQMGARVLPALNRTIGVWEADGLQIDLTSLPAGSFVNVYQSFATAGKTTAKNKSTVVSIAGDWWYLDQNTCGSYHQDGWGCTYDQTLDDPTWTPQQRALLLGGETAMWGEGINADNADAYIWRGAAAAAERLWSPLALTPSHGLAAGRFAEHLCRLQTLGVKAGPIAPGFCPADAGAPASSSSSSLALAARAIKAAAREAAGAGQALTLTSEQASVLAAVL